MLLAQHNITRFFEDKRARQFERTPDNIESMVFFPTGTIPMLQFVVNTIYVTGQYVWQLKLYDTDDNEITLPSSIYMSWYAGAGFTPGTGIYNIYYAGTDLASMTKGYYYLKLTNGIVSAYSEVFGWDDSMADYLKIVVQTANLGNDQATLHTLGLTNTFYLSAEDLGIKPKINQEGIENNAVTDIMFGSRAVTREFNIDSDTSIYMFLSSLGLQKANGLVTITWFYETWTASDIMVEEIDNHTNGLYQIKLSFVDESETISMSNS